MLYNMCVFGINPKNSTGIRWKFSIKSTSLFSYKLNLQRINIYDPFLIEDELTQQYFISDETQILICWFIVTSFGNWMFPI